MVLTGSLTTHARVQRGDGIRDTCTAPYCVGTAERRALRFLAYDATTRLSVRDDRRAAGRRRVYCMEFLQL